MLSSSWRVFRVFFSSCDDQYLMWTATKKARKKKKKKSIEQEVPPLDPTSALAAALALAQKRIHDAESLATSQGGIEEVEKSKENGPTKSHSEIRAEKQAAKQAKRVRALFAPFCESSRALSIYQLGTLLVSFSILDKEARGSQEAASRVASISAGFMYVGLSTCVIPSIHVN